MAYNAVAQHDLDVPSDYGDSEPRGSPLEHHTSSFPPLSPGLESSAITHDEIRPSITRSREGSIPMRHPTPDLQSLQGAYIGNVERLEHSAERLSLSSSDIGEEIRKMRLEQKRSDSRRSSILNSQSEEQLSGPFLNRQLSYGQGSHASNSIVGTNSVARSGGFSPAAYFASPRGSVRSGSWSNHNSVKGRSASQGPRLTQVTEPEQEGKPLDSPLSTRFAPAVPLLPSPSRPLQVDNSGNYNLNDVEIPTTQSPEPEQEQEQEQEIADDVDQPRASVDTYRQANGLFQDFDGTHADDPLHTPSPPPDHRMSQRPTSQMLHTAYQPQEDMVYYPAPVPMILNLPKRLSKLPAAPKRDQRHSEMLGNLPPDARKSAAWLPEMLESAEEDHVSAEHDEQTYSKTPNRRTMANIPPQLRATMFFDQPAARQDIAVKGESAVATLDSILDASAFAPVSAFIDHPYAGHMGADIYGRAPVKPRASIAPPELADKRKRRSSVNKLMKRSSTTDLLDGGKQRHSSLLSWGNFGKRKSSAQQFEDAQEYPETEAADAHREDAPLQHRDGPDFDPEDPEFEDARGDADVRPEEDMLEEQEFSGAPTTLLAELQLRKQEQKKRTRTAATAFPGGMHSTLLQLDAVAQVEKQAREKKHTQLAWEDPEALRPGAEDEDNDNVPLGVLYGERQMDAREKARRFDEDRPLGLIARREMEDNEPLSHRRARLRGEAPPMRNSSFAQSNTMHTLDFPNLQNQEPPKEDSDDENPNETLAQRRARIKATQIPVAPRRVSTDFASEIMSQFGGLEPSALPADSPDPVKRTATKTPDLDEVEETLGQRKKRLQGEAAAANQATRPPMSKRRSMADILQAHPAAGAGLRSVSNEVKYAPAPHLRNTAWAVNVNRQAGLGGMIPGVGPINGYTQPPLGNANNHTGAPGYGGTFAHGHGPPISVDPRQRDMIDRWRQSIMH